MTGDKNRPSESGRRGDSGRGSESRQESGRQGGAGNFANDREKASQAGRKGGENSRGGGRDR